MEIITTTLLIINCILFAVCIYRIEKIEKQRKNNLIDKTIMLEQIRELSLAMDLMAEDLTTDYHDKVWIIQHYLREVRNEHTGSIKERKW